MCIRDSRSRLQRVGAGAELVRVHDVRFEICSAAGVRRSRGAARSRRRGVRGGRKRAVRLYVVFVVPSAPCGRSWRVPSVRESDQPFKGTALMLIVRLKPDPTEMAFVGSAFRRTYPTLKIPTRPTSNASNTPIAAKRIHCGNETPPASSTAISAPLVGVNSSVNPAPV